MHEKSSIKTIGLNRDRVTLKEDLAMKSITTLEANSKARLLIAVISYRRATEKIEKDLKVWIKNLMGEDTAVIIGDFLVTKKTQSRKDLDRNALETAFGDISSYEKETIYEVLDLKTFRKKSGVL